MKPGSFDMAQIQSLETPAIAFFLTLPAPINALDAWEAMEPIARRMAELLDGVVLDESRNALGRQRIAHLREELRTYDRQHEAPPIRSEEHTSELQSLMRISYAVFCLKKKTHAPTTSCTTDLPTQQY